MNCYHGKLWKISGLLLEIYIMQGISWTFMLPRGKRPPEYLQIGIFFFTNLMPQLPLFSHDIVITCYNSPKSDLINQSDCLMNEIAVEPG